MTTTIDSASGIDTEQTTDSSVTVRLARRADGSPIGAAAFFTMEDLAALGVTADATEVTFEISGRNIRVHGR